MHSKDGSLSIVFNGEIFNYIELRDDLIKEGHRFETTSDTEVILPRIRGGRGAMCREIQWAVGICHLGCQENKSFFSPRDRMGIRPAVLHEDK